MNVRVQLLGDISRDRAGCVLVAPALLHFYADLRDPAYETAIAVYHQRYSTNTFPAWSIAQPFHMLSHKGEINTLQGNITWMRAREAEWRWGGDQRPTTNNQR